MEPLSVQLGWDEGKPRIRFDIAGFAHPEVAEPDGLDLLICRVHADAAPVTAAFDVEVRVRELLELRDYLAEINSGNGPPGTFTMAGGLLDLAFAPSRRGPVLCGVRLKSVDASHVRLEYLVTLEPESITRSIASLETLERAAAQ